jgi:hypothetical protein
MKANLSKNEDFIKGENGSGFEPATKKVNRILLTRPAPKPQAFAGLPGSGFPPIRKELLFLRRGLFLGAGAAESLAVFESAFWGDPGPKPKKDPGNFRGFDCFGKDWVSLCLVARSLFRRRPDLLRRDLRSGTRGFDASATNQSFAGQTTGIL